MTQWLPVDSGQLELVDYKPVNTPQAGLYGVNGFVCNHKYIIIALRVRRAVCTYG